MRREDCAKGLILLLIIAMIITASARDGNVVWSEGEDAHP